MISFRNENFWQATKTLPFSNLTSNLSKFVTNLREKQPWSFWKHSSKSLIEDTLITWVIQFDKSKKTNINMNLTHEWLKQKAKTPPGPTLLMISVIMSPANLSLPTEREAMAPQNGLISLIAHLLCATILSVRLANSLKTRRNHKLNALAGHWYYLRLWYPHIPGHLAGQVFFSSTSTSPCTFLMPSLMETGFRGGTLHPRLMILHGRTDAVVVPSPAKSLALITTFETWSTEKINNKYNKQVQN